VANNSFKPTPLRGAAQFRRWVPSLFDNIRLGVQTAAKFGMPATLIFYPLFVLFGSVSPWKPADLALGSYGNQTPIMVSGSDSYHSSGNISSHVVSRGYVLFPSMFTNPKVVSVVQVNDSEPTVSESAGMFVYIASWLVACVIATWWFWLRPHRPNGNGT
jgi:hypothetical protein